ncbi:MAG TPA: choice-of-anchor J domain-containing protein [Bacteroidales bacterium]|nr:choice-of-anchor J domain-containing protein [Bacteroidales bacterium]
MKKIVYILTLLMVVFSACDPNEEIYEQLDELKEPYKGSVEYTLTANDYEILTSFALANAANEEDSTWAEYVTEFEAFNDKYPGSEYIPYLLPDLFPAYNQESAANVTFNYIADIPDELAIYSNAEVIEFTSNYYNAVNEFVGTAGYFYPEYNPDFFIPDILNDSISDAVEEEIYSIKYKYSDVDPIMTESDYPIYFEEKFETLTASDPVSLENWIVYDEAGTETWEGREYDDNLYAQFSAHDTGEPTNISWLITPAVDLTDYSEAIFNFKSKDGYNNGDPLEVLISTDYTGTGDPNTATWVDLNPTLSTGNSSGYASNWLESGDINIDAYTGSDIYIAFKYTGGDGDITTTMQIDDVTVRVYDPGYVVTDEKTPYTKYDIYEYDGSSWMIVDDVYHLSSKDYAAMGAPGENDNFSSDESPRDYLPNLLKAMYPTAGEGVTKILIYDYYTGIEGTLTLADQYTYTNGEWVSLYNYIDQTIQQFIHNGEEWVFDPTVRFTMSGSDYQIIVDYVETNIGADYIDSYGTAEFYFGAGSYHSNFDKRISQRLSYEPETFEGLSEEEALELIDQRVQGGIVVLLQNKYPDAVPQVGGEDVHYIVTYETYNNDYSRSYPTVNYRCTEAASGDNPPQFELIEGPYEEE